MLRRLSEHVQIYEAADFTGMTEEAKDLIVRMAKFAFYAYGWVMTIHVGRTDKGHSKDSRHYPGDAVDFHWEKDGKVVPLAAQRAVADLFDWAGKGEYPEWKSPGLHRDRRSLGELGQGTSWMLKGGEYLVWGRDPIEKMLELEDRP